LAAKSAVGARFTPGRRPVAARLEPPTRGSAGRIAANFDVFGFTLAESEVARIDALGR